MESVLITGGSGLIGTRLTKLLIREGFAVSHLARSKNSKCGVKVYTWNPSKEKLEPGALDQCDYIIHLAGEGIADQKWTPERKLSILKSRTQGPAFLLNELKKQNKTIKGFFSASGINYFGSSTSEKIFTEHDLPAEEFIADVVVEWEKAAAQFEFICRVATFRFGLVLDKNEGGLPKMAFPAQFGLGAALGTGKQWVPWIHIEDAARCFLHAIQNNSVKGNYNAVATEHVTNKTFTKTLAKNLHVPAFLPNVPAFVLKLMFGELSQLILSGSRASNEKLLSTGFEFHFPDLNSALKEIYAGKRI